MLVLLRLNQLHFKEHAFPEQQCKVSVSWHVRHIHSSLQPILELNAKILGFFNE